MGQVLVTGARGFIGRNLIATLSTNPDVEVLSFDVEDAPESLPDRAGGLSAYKQPRRCDKRLPAKARPPGTGVGCRSQTGPGPTRPRRY